MNQIVQSDMIDWLFKHGKHWRTDVPPDEKVVIGECFQLLDADGSGALDADELEYLFETLGLNVEHEDIVHMMEKYAGVHDGAEIGYELFEVMMADFELGLGKVQPSAQREGFATVGTHMHAHACTPSLLKLCNTLGPLHAGA